MNGIVKCGEKMIPIALYSIEDDYERNFMINLYNKYYQISKNKAYSILHDYDEAEESVQDAFVKLIENLPRIIKLEPAKLSVYVIITVRNVAIDHYRKKRNENNKEYLFGDDEILEKTADDKPLPEDLYLKKEELEELSDALKKLPEKSRMILEAKYILRQTDKEIGEMIGVSEKSVRMYLTRARRQAYELMKGGVAHER